MANLIHVVVAVTLSAIFYQSFRFVCHMGTRTVAYRHYPGPCDQFPGINNGSEDIAMMKDGRAFFSTGFGHVAHNTGESGAIFLIDLNEDNYDTFATVKMKVVGNPIYEQQFVPHGLAVFEHSTYPGIFLFSIVHRFGLSEVAIFEFDGVDTLIFQSSVNADVLGVGVLNDVQPCGPTTFYASEFQRTRNPFLSIIEMILLLPVTRVVYWDGQTPRIVADNIKGANGLAMPKGGRLLYVAAHLGKELLVYERFPDNTLKFVYSAFLDSALDNLFIDDNGDVYTGAHPQPNDFIKHFLDYNHPSPSQVLRVRFIHHADGRILRHEVDEVFSDPGMLISASSSAVLFHDRLLIGSVFHKLILCDVVYMEPVNDYN